MNIDLLNPAHLLLLSLAFLFWGWLTSYVTEKEENAKETNWKFPACLFGCINVGVVLASLIQLIIKSL